MAVMTNYCKANIRFICTTHKQDECFFFEKNEDVSSLTCRYGLPDRICNNERARQRALAFYSVQKLYIVKDYFKNFLLRSRHENTKKKKKD